MSKWIEWKGGDGTKTDCPVDKKEYVNVRFRDGYGDASYGAVPADFYLNSEIPELRSWWDNRGHPHDIVAYRLSKANGDKDE